MQTFVDLLTWDLSLASGVVALSGLMRGFAGFGSGMLMAPIFAILFGPPETVGTIALMELCVSAQLLPEVSRTVQWRFVLLMGLVAAAFMPLGSWILVAVNPEALARVMAAIVLVFVGILAVGWRYEGTRKIPITIGIGAISGTMMAATSMGNPPVLLYMLSGPDGPATNRANIIGYFVVTQVFLIATLAGLMILGLSTLVRAVMLFPAFALFAWIGGRLFRVANESFYRKFALLLLFCSGLMGLMR